jgi:hypothetical protein
LRAFEASLVLGLALLGLPELLLRPKPDLLVFAHLIGVPGSLE